MRRLLLIVGLLLMLTLSSCVYGNDGGEPDMGNTPDTSATETTAPLPEIPNETEDGYSKRY